MTIIQSIFSTRNSSGAKTRCSNILENGRPVVLSKVLVLMPCVIADGILYGMPGLQTSSVSGYPSNQFTTWAIGLGWNA